MQSRRLCRRQIRRFHFDADMWLGASQIPVRTHLFSFIASPLQVTEAFPKSTVLNLIDL
jgi:hypothetical protein